MPEQDSGQQRSDTRDEADEMARLQEQINNLPVGEHILYMMHSLSALAIDRLGLSAEGAARRDVEQSRLAIDAFRALLGVLEESRSPEEIAAHRGVLSQLQLAYVGALGSAAQPDVETSDASSEAEEAQTEEAEAEEAPQPSKPRPSAGGPTKKSASTGTAKTAKKNAGTGAAKTTKKSASAGAGKTAKKSSGASKRKGEKKDS